ncbi:hypothetical protein IHE55_17635 [Streptomyces pactum]|uniref:DUF3618 domain-containing protein n=1 Tax=Streptomyces pactum TaxID=68249 RepID=A0ABS0NMU6_9ACTN|nr:hypothetical protein [Streptomyces pactum]
MGLGLPETAAETEATTSATVNRLRHAHAALVERLPELRAARPAEQRRILHRRLAEAAAAQPLDTRPARTVRLDGERATRRRTRAAIGLPVSFAVAVGLAMAVSPDRGAPAPEPEQRPAATQPGSR